MPDEPNNSGAQSLERKLATILSADVAEYSRLMNEDEEATLRTFRGHKQVFESLVAMHRGRIFNTAGDAILAEFNSAVEAVRCATDIQAALRTRNDQLQPSRRNLHRINLGDVMLQGQDLMGDGVNVAARLQTAAEPGGICISGSVHDQIRNKLSLSFLSLGERSFKNIPQPVRTFSITEAEGHGTLPSPKAESGGTKNSSTKWIAAAIVLLLAGGAYWAYTNNERSKAESPIATATTVPLQATAKPVSEPLRQAEVTVPPTADKPALAAQSAATPPNAPLTPKTS
jgi:adenylate cyclase